MILGRINGRVLVSLVIMAGVIAAAIVAAPHVARTLIEGASRLNPAAIAAACGVQVGTTLLCGLALKSVTRTGDLVSATASRWVRDAASNLLPLFPGAAEAAGARLMAIRGQPAASALGATAVDIAAETLAQVGYTFLGLALAPTAFAQLPWQKLHTPHLAGLLAALAVVIAAAGVLAVVFAPQLRRLWARAVEGLRFSGVWLCLALHCVAWLMGGITVWIGSHLLGSDLSLPGAIALESLVYAGRGLFFFIPAGVGVQEAGFVFFGSLMNVPAADALALGLLLRARDAVCGVPALAIWLRLEHLATRRAGTERGAPGEPRPATDTGR